MSSRRRQGVGRAGGKKRTRKVIPRMLRMMKRITSTKTSADGSRSTW